ncbi:ATP-binding cassette domain-containing protein [Levilactobacillus sp.]|uniref:ATP-binding cassette domain-containing protein n=1 Tax=Levilactobacillus sp. TaxID=2767919 RepID=UPI003DA99F2C
MGALIEHPAIYPFLTGKQNLALYAMTQRTCNNSRPPWGCAPTTHAKTKGHSLGMKQKPGIAIALLNHPQLVILDEPMNGLDVESTITARRLIQQYAAAGTALLISSHILNELQKVMTQVILIDHGQIIVDQPINTFNQRHQRDYRLMTTNPQLTAQLLAQSHTAYQQADATFRVKRTDILTIQDLLMAHHIYLQELTPLRPILE